MCEIRPPDGYTLYHQKLWFSIGFTRKVETCAIMEREARKEQEKQYAGNSKERICKSTVRDEMDNAYNKGNNAQQNAI